MSSSGIRKEPTYPYSQWSSSQSFGANMPHMRGTNRPKGGRRGDELFNYYDQTPHRQNFGPATTSMEPSAIWREVSSSSGVTLDDKLQGRVTTAVNQLKQGPPRWNHRLKGYRAPTSSHVAKRRQQDNNVLARNFTKNDYTSNYVHTSELPTNFVRNVKNPVEGYPKLQRLFQLKETQTDKYACKPYGSRIELDKMVATLNKWIHIDKLAFDVIMIGSLTENQFIIPLLTQLPLERLCSKPGFLFVWASAKKINELTGLLNSDGWAKKFRRSEELVFVPVTKDSPYYPGKDTMDEESVFENTQWHCWMCITGTVRRSSDGQLIHCNVDTDLKVESPSEKNDNMVVPDHIYQVAENFSSATRRLHIIPSRSGFDNPVRPRRGWVIMSPDIIVDNFEPSKYKNDISTIGFNVPQNQEIESIRPKSPTLRNTSLSSTTNSYHSQNNRQPITSS